MPLSTLHSPLLRPLSAQSQRAAVWKQLQGLWKERPADPIQELQAIRSGMERPLPALGE